MILNGVFIVFIVLWVFYALILYADKHPDETISKVVIGMIKKITFSP